MLVPVQFGGETVTDSHLTHIGGDDNEPFTIELLQRMQDFNIVRIGDPFQETKLSPESENANGLLEINDMFALLGDPSTILARP